jgi:hypothetical protein
MEEWMYRSILTSALVGGGQLHAPATLPPGKDDVEKSKFLTLPGLELRSLSRPARSQ